GLLEPAGFRDYGPNGLQVPGAAEVGTVATGVSAHRELFERAIAAGAQLIVVHHGLFWDGDPRALTPAMATRLKLLLEADVGLAANLDAFLTGEPAERVMAIAREGHIHFVAAGHYATETFGVRRLGELLAERFGVEHRFIDVPNPV